MKRILLPVFLIACLGMVGATQKTRNLCQGFAPKNNLYIPATLFSDSGLSEAEWTGLFDKFEKIYSPIFAAQGAKLVLNRLWDDGVVNASADQEGKIWIVNMYGGLARYPGMTKDGMALVVCHEAGHHLGGAPKIGGDANFWATNEGESDYFAALKCMRKLLSDEDNANIVSKMSVHPTIQKSCSTQFQDAQDQSICIRTATGGALLGHILAEMGRDTDTNVDTPDKAAVAEIDDSHPAAQCRLDTYYQGATCIADHMTDLSNKDYHTGTCTAPKHKMGLRPTCWFKPDADDDKINLEANKLDSSVK